ncbi:MAG: GNAT family N-acetyltransferase [Promethearchaeota archaeon]
MNRNIVVDIATPDDIEALKALTKQLVEDLDQEFEPKRFDWGIRRRLYDPLQRHGILIAKDSEKNNEVIGMMVAELRIDPYGSSEGYIKQVFLKSEYRGRGLGSVLLHKALEHLKKVKVQKVKVNLKSRATKAGELYRKTHFKKVYEVLELDLDEYDVFEDEHK